MSGLSRVLGCFRRRDESVDDADAMDWRPTTPPASQQSIAPHYYKGYMPGGWPELPPKKDIPRSKVRRLPPDPEWVIRDAKRVRIAARLAKDAACHRVRAAGNRAGTLASHGARRACHNTVRGGVAVARESAAVVSQVAVSAGISTVAILRRFNRENPRDRQIGAAGHRVHADMTFARLQDNSWAPHYDEQGVFVPTWTQLPYRAPKDTAIFPADDPNLQLERELIAAIPTKQRFAETPIRRFQYKPDGTRVDMENHKVFNIQRFAQENDRRARALVESKNANIPAKDTSATNNTSSKNLETPNENASTPGTPKSTITYTFGSSDNDKGMELSPKTALQYAAIDRLPGVNSFEKRRMKLAIRKTARSAKYGTNTARTLHKPNTTPTHQSPSSMFSFKYQNTGTQTDPVDENAEKITEHEDYWKNLERTGTTEVDIHETYVTTTDRATQIRRPLFPKRILNLSTQLAVQRSPQNIPTPLASPTKEQFTQIQPDSVESSQPRSPVSGPAATTTHIERIKTPQPQAAPDRPSTPDSDISSTCDITPLPPYPTARSVADAVGSLFSPSLKAPRKSPSPRTSSSVGAKSPPGAWIDEETTMEKDEIKKEAVPILEFKTPARRTVSLTIRESGDKQEEKKTVEDRIRTPAEHDTPPKSANHGKTARNKKQMILEKQAEAKNKQNQYTITPLSQEWDDKVEEFLTTGMPSAELTAKDLARCAPPRNASSSHDNWLNDEVINKYLKMITQYGTSLAGRPEHETPSHHAFNSFFYTKLADPKQGVKSVTRWANKARISGKRLLEVEMVFVPVNHGSHWTLAVVSGTKKRITYYDSLGGKGRTHMENLLGWVEKELGGAFVRHEWKLEQGASGRQANMDDCGVFTITNARSLALGMAPEEFSGAELARVQRRRIVAELANGAFLVGGA